MKKLCLLFIFLYSMFLIGCQTKSNKVADIKVEDITCCVDIFDITKYSLNVTYEDGSEEEVLMRMDMFSSEEQTKFLVSGNHIINFTYNDYKGSFNLLLEERKIIKIETSQNNITAYINEFDYSTIMLKLYYNDNTTEEDELSKEYLDRENLLALGKAGTHDIVIKHEDVSTILHVNLLPNEIAIEDLDYDVIVYCKTEKVNDEYVSVFYALGNKEFASLQFTVKKTRNVSQYELTNVNENVVYNKTEDNLSVSYVSSVNTKGVIELFTIVFDSSQQYANFTINYNIKTKVVCIENNQVNEITSCIFTFTR